MVVTRNSSDSTTEQPDLTNKKVNKILKGLKITMNSTPSAQTLSQPAIAQPQKQQFKQQTKQSNQTGIKSKTNTIQSRRSSVDFNQPNQPSYMKPTNASKRKSVTFDANNSNTSSASQIDDESPASSDSSSVADKTQYYTANNSMVLTSENDTDNEPSKVAKSGIEVQKLKKINSESILDTLLENQSSSAEAEIAKFKEAGGNTLEEFLEYVKHSKSSPKEIQISNLNNTKIFINF